MRRDGLVDVGGLVADLFVRGDRGRVAQPHAEGVFVVFVVGLTVGVVLLVRGAELDGEVVFVGGGVAPVAGGHRDGGRRGIRFAVVALQAARHCAVVELDRLQRGFVGHDVADRGAGRGGRAGRRGLADRCGRVVVEVVVEVVFFFVLVLVELVLEVGEALKVEEQLVTTGFVFQAGIDQGVFVDGLHGRPGGGLGRRRRLGHGVAVVGLGDGGRGLLFVEAHQVVGHRRQRREIAEQVVVFVFVFLRIGDLVEHHQAGQVVSGAVQGARRGVGVGGVVAVVVVLVVFVAGRGVLIVGEGHERPVYWVLLVGVGGGVAGGRFIPVVEGGRGASGGAERGRGPHEVLGRDSAPRQDLVGVVIAEAEADVERNQELAGAGPGSAPRPCGAVERKRVGGQDMKLCVGSLEGRQQVFAQLQRVVRAHVRPSGRVVEPGLLVAAGEALQLAAEAGEAGHQLGAELLHALDVRLELVHPGLELGVVGLQGLGPGGQALKFARQGAAHGLLAAKIALSGSDLAGDLLHGHHVRGEVGDAVLEDPLDLVAQRSETVGVGHQASGEGGVRPRTVHLTRARGQDAPDGSARCVQLVRMLWRFSIREIVLRSTPAMRAALERLPPARSSTSSR
jgi:hypothetical protein